MAMARARMAISHCCNGIRQISVRHFKAGASKKNHNSNNGSYSSGLPSVFGPSPSLFVFMLGYSWYNLSELRELEEAEKNAIERRKKKLEEMGINRESCEAKIAQIKQEIESGSASNIDRYNLKNQEEWLELFTRGA